MISSGIKIRDYEYYCAVDCRTLKEGNAKASVAPTASEIIQIEEPDCVICSDDFSKDLVARMNCCGRAIHENCLLSNLFQYNRTACPLCNKKIIDLTEEQKEEQSSSQTKEVFIQLIIRDNFNAEEMVNAFLYCIFTSRTLTCEAKLEKWHSILESINRSLSAERKMELDSYLLESQSQISRVLQNFHIVQVLGGSDPLPDAIMMQEGQDSSSIITLKNPFADYAPQVSYQFSHFPLHIERTILGTNLRFAELDAELDAELTRLQNRYLNNPRAHTSRLSTTAVLVATISAVILSAIIIPKFL